MSSVLSFLDGRIGINKTDRPFLFSSRDGGFFLTSIRIPILRAWLCKRAERNVLPRFPSSFNDRSLELL